MMLKAMNLDLCSCTEVKNVGISEDKKMN
uniref:Uncharacterized protein n=1 Tax=Arundo donax TaxID=35708 RepID=A0A0A9A4F0_ARUDO